METQFRGNRRDAPGTAGPSLDRSRAGAPRRSRTGSRPALRSQRRSANREAIEQFRRGLQLLADAAAGTAAGPAGTGFPGAPGRGADGGQGLRRAGSGRLLRPRPPVVRGAERPRSACSSCSAASGRGGCCATNWTCAANWRRDAAAGRNARRPGTADRKPTSCPATRPTIAATSSPPCSICRPAGHCSIWNDRRQHALHTGLNSGVTILCQMALALWQLGYPGSGLPAHASRRWQLADQLAHPFSRAFALYHQRRLPAVLPAGRTTWSRASTPNWPWPASKGSRSAKPRR